MVVRERMGPWVSKVPLDLQVLKASLVQLAQRERWATMVKEGLLVPLESLGSLGQQEQREAMEFPELLVRRGSKERRELQDSLGFRVHQGKMELM